MPAARSPGPRRISPLVLLVEAGSPPPPLEGNEIALPQVPSMAFGDGSHPTTRLCALAVDQICRMQAPGSVLDVGTGSGVLARIARARGARFVAATDIDPKALSAARENASLDSHAVEMMIVNEPPDCWGPRFDLVVANILEGPLRDLAPSLARALAPGGSLLLSGFTPLQVPAIGAVYTRLGLRREIETSQEGWALMMLRREIEA